MKTEINISSEFGRHLADGTKAVGFRVARIDPLLSSGIGIELDFSGVRHANSSFINGLLVAPFEEFGGGLVKKISFRGCNELLKVLINTAIGLGVEKHRAHARASA